MDYEKWTSEIVPELSEFWVIDNLKNSVANWEKGYRFICHYMPYSPSELDALEMSRFFTVMDEAEELHRQNKK